jgi:putative acetyltransferase
MTEDFIMQSKIIAFDEQYHEQLVDIWHRAVIATHSFLSPEDIEFYHSMVSNGALRGVELYIELNEMNSPTGFIGVYGSNVEMLFVDPKYHGQGIGSRLLEHIEQLKGSNLKVDVNEQNESAHGFYKKYGFVQIGRSELDGSGRPFPLLHMELQRT